MLEQWLKLHRWYKERYSESWMYAFDYDKTTKNWLVLYLWFDDPSIHKWTSGERHTM